jgi:hypothetical protein
MTVNELFKCWLHNKNPSANVKVWDRSTGDYIYMTNPPLPNQDAESVSQMEVKCFYTSETEHGMKTTLIINVGEYK